MNCTTSRTVESRLRMGKFLSVVMRLFLCIYSTLLPVAQVSAASWKPEGGAIDAKLSMAASSTKSSLPVEGRAPGLDGATSWLGSNPIKQDQLKGKVVLIDFWTYSCINCIRVIPYLNAWEEKYRNAGLVVIGVHTPEFDFETGVENIQRAVSRFHISYPIAVDSNYKIWNAFQNKYWPAYYLVDANGRIRYHQFGEGNYTRAEEAIRDLLAEVHGSPIADSYVRPNGIGEQAAPSLREIGSQETYLGYRQSTGFSSPERLHMDRGAVYSTPLLKLNQWALSGEWIVSAGKVSSTWAGGGIAYRFQSRDLHLVLGLSSDNKPVRFQVTIDGQNPGSDHGFDTDANGFGVVTGPRLYQLVRQREGSRERTFQIHFEDPGVQAFAFTFG